MHMCAKTIITVILMIMKVPANFTHNSRFYILTFSLLFSVWLASFLRLSIASNDLYGIRLQQIFGFVAIIYLYLALILSPLSRVMPKNRYMQQLLFARRAIGVSAAYFALLHAVIGLWNNLGGPSQLGLLPVRFKVAVGLGAITLTILLALASTSFDVVVTRMTKPRWKMLHRFVYAAGALVVVHAWLIGTHSVYAWVQCTSFGAMAVLFLLEAFRIATCKPAVRLHKHRAHLRIIVTIILWLLLLLPVVLLPKLIATHHTIHGVSSSKGGHGHE